jgi:hypothetical protein
MLAATTRQLCELQDILYAVNGLHATGWKMKAHPKLVMPNFAAAHARRVHQALASRWLLQQFLPTEAANDLPELPGAA